MAVGVFPFVTHKRKPHKGPRSNKPLFGTMYIIITASTARLIELVGELSILGCDGDEFGCLLWVFIIVD